MNRYSLNLSLIPTTGAPGRFNIWVHTTEWDGKDCRYGERICNGETVEMADMASEAEVLHFALEAIDRAYQEVSMKLAAVKRPSVTETNARPSDTSVPSSLT